MNMEDFNLEKTRQETSLEKLSKDTIELNESERNASLANIEKGDKLDDKTLPDEMVVNAVRRACKFFGIPEVPIVNAHGACVWPNDTRTYNDDVFGFNREQLMSLGISGEDSLTLIYTHECAHRTLQGAYNDAWEEELACDFFAGVHAGMEGMDIDNFEASLGSTPGGDTHPNGALRADFIEYGKQAALELKARGIEPTYNNCLEYLNKHIKEKGGLIAEYRQRFDPNVSSNTFTGTDYVSVASETADISFGSKYSDAEISKIRSDVDRAQSEVNARRNDVSNWESKVSLNDTKEHRANGDYAHAVSRLNEAKSRYNHAVDELNNAKRKLNSAT